MPFQLPDDEVTPQQAVAAAVLSQLPLPLPGMPKVEPNVTMSPTSNTAMDVAKLTLQAALAALPATSSAPTDAQQDTPLSPTEADEKKPMVGVEADRDMRVGLNTGQFQQMLEMVKKTDLSKISSLLSKVS